MDSLKKAGKALWIGLIVVFSLFITACGQKDISINPITECYAPNKPILPLFEYANLESTKNIETLLERDDIIRQYLKGLEDALACYEIIFTKGKTE